MSIVLRLRKGKLDHKYNQLHNLLPQFMLKTGWVKVKNDVKVTYIGWNHMENEVQNTIFLCETSYNSDIKKNHFWC